MPPVGEGPPEAMAARATSQQLGEFPFVGAQVRRCRELVERAATEPSPPTRERHRRCRVGELDLIPIAGRLELWKRGHLGNIRDRSDQQPPFLGRGEQLGLRLGGGECCDGLYRFVERGGVELAGVQQLKKRDIVEVSQLRRAVARLVHPIHEALRKTADHVSEEEENRHVPVGRGVDETQLVGTDTLATGHPPGERCAHCFRQHIELCRGAEGLLGGKRRDVGPGRSGCAR